MFAVAVQSDGNNVGIYLIRRGGVLICLITGLRRYPRHLQQEATHQEVYIDA